MEPASNPHPGRGGASKLEVMTWEPYGDDTVSYFRDYLFVMSPDEPGMWVYIQLSKPTPGDNRPLKHGSVEYFPKKFQALDYIKRMRKKLFA